MGRALVLNVSYEPLGIVADRRAIVLVLGGRADGLEDSGEVVRSESLSIDVPSVIRLRTLVRVPYRRRISLSRRAVLYRDNGDCQYCGRQADSIDHIVPRSRGGEHTWENVVAACRRCNLAKGNHFLHETNMALARPARAPKHVSWLLLTLGSVPDEWKKYLEPERLSA